MYLLLVIYLIVNLLLPYLLLFFPTSVYNTLSALKIISCRPNSIFLKVLKNCASKFTNHLTFLFNAYLRLSVISNVWKQGIIMPIYKNHPRRCPEIYRPIYIISSTNKTMKRLIQIHQLSFLLDNNLTHPCFIILAFALLSFKAKLNSNLSSSANASSNVPQGSVLSPLLSTYANDLKIWNSGNPISFQHDIDAIYAYFIKNNSSFNPSKCNHFSFGKYSDTSLFLPTATPYLIPRVNTVKNLNVTFFTNLFLSKHNLKVTSTNFKLINFFRCKFSYLTKCSVTILVLYSSTSQTLLASQLYKTTFV